MPKIGIGLAVSTASNAGALEVLETFDSTWDSGANKTIKLPLVSGGSYNFTVDWGDGSSDTITAYDDSDVEHLYASDAVYTVKIEANVLSGGITGWGGLYTTSDQKKMTGITSWGAGKNNLVLNASAGFYNQSSLNVTASGAPTLTNSDALVNLFRGCTSLVNIGTPSEWDISGCNSMMYTFHVANF